MLEIVFFLVCSLGWVLVFKVYKELKSLRKTLIKISISRGYNLGEHHCSEKEYREAEKELLEEIKINKAI